EFRERDLYGDGFITPDEVLPRLKKPTELRLRGGRAEYTGTVAEMPEERYKGKKSFQVLTVALQEGKTYRFDMESKAFQSFIHLEDPDGNVVQEKASAGIGGSMHFVYRAADSGTYRIIATSAAGVRIGDFTLSVRAVSAREALPKD